MLEHLQKYLLRVFSRRTRMTPNAKLNHGGE
jgi:hypothetical protein